MKIIKLIEAGVLVYAPPTGRISIPRRPIILHTGRELERWDHIRWLAKTADGERHMTTDRSCGGPEASPSGR